MSPFDEHGISSPLLRNMVSGEVRRGSELPTAALYCLTRQPDWGPNDWPPTGSDGKSVVCVLPDGHHWYIDSRANNCTLPNDREHRCWVRHGTLGERLHVDKNGRTCSAGAGSIASRNWHGFLHNGKLSANG